MNTRHLYTFQDGRVLVLEHIVAIGSIYPSRDEGMFFQVDMLGDVCYCYPNVKFEVTVQGETAKYKTTERAELIKALAAI
jgi:hypothetical protein